jgi:hypothetical protein
MFYFRQVVAIVCLVLLAWTLIAPIGLSSFFLVLPVIATLSIILVSLLLPGTESDFRVYDPSLFSISLRGPPQQ